MSMAVRVVSKRKGEYKKSKEDAEMDERVLCAVRSAIAKAKICKKPIAKYDAKTKRAYLEYPSGAKRYVK